MATGVILILISFIIRYWISRRKFYRRTHLGLEAFSSFQKAFATNAFEKLMWVISTLVLIAGILVSGLGLFMALFG